MEICGTCETKLADFYYFKMRAEAVRANLQSASSHDKLYDLQEQITDKVVYNTLQVVRSFIARHSAVEIKEDEVDNSLKITPTSKNPTFQEAISSVKQEPMEIKIEPINIQIKEEPDDIFNLIQSFGDSTSSEELTNSSEGSLSRLPAFEESTYFDGDKFVLRSEVPPKKLKEAKKRQRKPECWATNVQKKLRNAGQRYRSAKGDIVAARSMGSPCSCRQNCATKVNEKNRLMNFSSYWNLEDVKQKRKFIFDHIKLERPRRAMTKSRAFSRLILHFLDVVNQDSSLEQIKVCKTMFLSTLDISNTVITTTVKMHNQYFDDFEKKLISRSN